MVTMMIYHSYDNYILSGQSVLMVVSVLMAITVIMVTLTHGEYGKNQVLIVMFINGRIIISNYDYSN